MGKYYLMPCERQNPEGFGRKAVVEVMDDGTKVLYSYATKIAKITTGGLLVRLCDHDQECSSQTTMRHLAAFCVSNGREPITKKAWNEKPISRD